MKNKVFISILLFISFSFGWMTHAYYPFENKGVNSDINTSINKRTLDVYSIENMKKSEWETGKITIDKVIGDEDEYTSYQFSYTFSPNFSNEQKTTTGQINIPKENYNYSIILMFRGYIDQKLYTTGTGTRPAASYFAKNGFVTIAPDFLGYASSDSESGNIFETRFQTYVTAISLLKTLEQAKNNNKPIDLGSTISDSTYLVTLLTSYKSMNLWAHSNGGQIALTTLAVTESVYPTTLWAPVTKPFPYSVLYYTDESQDGGKFIRKELAFFEEQYNVDLYSFTNYLDKIKSPLQFHQGLGDDAIPVGWTDDIVTKLRKLDREVTYWKYPSADHNMRPDWDTVVQRDVDFFQKHTSS